MRKIYIAIAISLAAGFAAGAFVLRTESPQPSAGSGIGAGDYFDQTAATEQRIRALEAAVAEERNARQLLEEELLALFAEIEELREAPQAQQSAERLAETAPREAMSRTESLRQRRDVAASEEGRVAALVDAGFAPDRADWILRREDELRLEAMQARFEAQRTGDMQALFAARNSNESALRVELGDADYERYLDAYGRPTAVSVGSVLESSPGQRAGLQVGDQIVSYDGQRVFSYTDINNQQLQGEVGESVVVDILRDGMSMQLVMPRGPIGIQAGRFRGR